MNNELKRFVKEPRIIFTLIVIILSVIAIGPTFVASEDGTYDINTRIKKGLDLSGGIRALISLEDSSQESADKVISVLNTRISSFGLKENIIRKVNIDGKWYVQLEIAGANEEELKDLLEKQGKFEGYIQRNVTFEKEKGILKINGKDYIFEKKDGIFYYNNQTLEVNKTIEIDGITIKVNNIQDNLITLDALVLKGEDIVNIDKSAQGSQVYNQGNQWQFQFRITETREAAERFAKVTKDIGIDGGSGGTYLSSNIDFYLDDKLVDSLRISSGLKGVVQTTISISGPGETKEDALNKMRQLEAILESGALPTAIEIEEFSEISPSLSQGFINVALYSILAAIITVSIILFIVYRELKFVGPMILTSLTEVLIIFGFAGLVGWTIDLPAIAGIVAAIGSGIDDQIVILDESKKKETGNLKSRLKRAFFIIFAAAATTGGAMLPLLSVGAGNVKGFAFTTIIGVLSGVLITRPAFSKVVEYLKR